MTRFGQQNAAKMTLSSKPRPQVALYDSALALRTLRLPREQPQVRLLEDEKPCGERPQLSQVSHLQPSQTR